MADNHFFSFTCEKCTYRGNRTHDSNYVSSTTVDDDGVRYRSWSESDRYPQRCRECSRQMKRYSRMVKRLDKIWSISYEMDKKYHRPKLITFALPSVVTENDSPEVELSKLKSLLPAARKILMDHGILGGVYVPEVTSRSHTVHGFTYYKHHAHVHMVAIAPFIHKTKLPKFCEMLMPLGLGRINYIAPKDKNWKTAKNRVASYISKYLCKDGRRTSSFGIYRGYELSTERSDAVSSSSPSN